MFETLFKYPLEAWRRGDFAFASHLPGEVRLLLTVVLVAAAVILYRKSPGRVTLWAKILLFSLRTAVLLVLLGVLLHPVLRFEKSNTDSAFVAVLVDSSRSMSIADASQNRARLAASQALLGAEPSEGKAGTGLLGDLSSLCPVRLFGFDSDLRRVRKAGDLAAEGDYTNIHQALRRLDDEMRGVKLAGLVMVSDGAHNTEGDPLEMAALMNQKGVPVFTVGMGSLNPPKDYEVMEVQAPRRVRQYAVADINVTVRCTGYPAPFSVQLKDGDEVVRSVEIRPKASTDLHHVKLTAFPERKGQVRYAIVLPQGEGEKVTQNNRKEFMIEVVDDRLPVLYIEGSPREEYRFIRRALSRDKDFRVVSILRTGKDRFVVQGADDEKEDFLKRGYPRRHEDLIRYEAIIFGDIESSFFSPEQLRMTEDFVRVKGGGFLMLGGVNSFDLGKYQGTPVADMLPVVLEPRSEPYKPDEFPIDVTDEGVKHPILHQLDDPLLNRRLWEKSPPLMGANVVRKIKPGAQLLAVNPRDQNVVLAVEYYGAGRTAAFTTGGSWYWRMTRPLKDELHEKFWKQFVRWLAVGARPKLNVELEKDIFGKGEPVTIRSTVLGQSLEAVNDAVVVARVKDPFGNVEEINQEWILSQDGVYLGRTVPAAEGEYEVEVTARISEKDEVKAKAVFSVNVPLVEFSEAGQRKALLEAMAGKTAGGKYFSEADAAKLPAEFKKAFEGSEAAKKTVEDRDVWDMPAVFLFLVAALGVEWWLRRRQGLS